MQWITTDKLVNFPFWGGAEAKAKQLSYTELEELEELLDNGEDNILTATQINDMMWNRFPDVCEMLGLECDPSGTVIRNKASGEAGNPFDDTLKGIREESPALAEAIEAGYKACMESANVTDAYQPDVVISDEPNYTVILSHGGIDPHPARISLQAYDGHDAIDEAIKNLKQHGYGGYAEEQQPEFPDDYIEVTDGWVPVENARIEKCTGIRATHVPEHFLPALVNADLTGLSQEDEAELDEFCKDLAESGIPASGLNPVCGPDGEFWDVDDDPATGKAVLCSAFVGK